MVLIIEDLLTGNEYEYHRLRKGCSIGKHHRMGSCLFPGKGTTVSILFEPTRIKTISLTKSLVRSATDNRTERGCVSESQGIDLVNRSSYAFGDKWAKTRSRKRSVC